MTLENNYSSVLDCCERGEKVHGLTKLAQQAQKGGGGEVVLSLPFLPFPFWRLPSVPTAFIIS